jgi:hypothetical protein
MSDGEQEEPLSLKDMRQWAEYELKDVAKAAELRTREVNEIVSTYASGQLTPEEATKRCLQYEERWGEALPGATVGDGVSDEAILARIDEARRQSALRLNRLWTRTR